MRTGIESALEGFINLEKTGEFKYARNLNRMKNLLRLLGFDSFDFKIAVIAGSKGKGSCALMSAGALCEAGLRVGLYTSPHLERWTERIQINGNEIPEEKAEAYLNEIKLRCADMAEAPTYFEVTTAIALLYFKDQKADAVILETGLGGRFDATNALKKEVSVVTSVGLEHTKVLGSTVEEIAKEKAGIFEQSRHLLTCGQKPEVLKVLREEANQLELTLERTYAEEGKLTAAKGRWQWHDDKGVLISPDAYGKHQLENALLAYRCAQLLGGEEHKEIYAKGINSTRLPGRFEVFKNRPPFIVDCAHSPESVRALVKTVEEVCPGETWTVLIALMSDKDATTIAGELKPLSVDRILSCSMGVERSMDAYQLSQAFSFASQSARYDLSAESVRNLFESDEAVLVCGSVYLAGYVRDALSGVSV